MCEYIGGCCCSDWQRKSRETEGRTNNKRNESNKEERKTQTTNIVRRRVGTASGKIVRTKKNSSKFVRSQELLKGNIMVLSYVLKFFSSEVF
jgi:hypothetical protein